MTYFLVICSIYPLSGWKESAKELVPKIWKCMSTPFTPTCFTCCQESSHCLIFRFASSSSLRTLVSSLLLEPAVVVVALLLNTGDGLGEKLPLTKWSQMLPETPFKPNGRKTDFKCTIQWGKRDNKITCRFWYWCPIIHKTWLWRKISMAVKASCIHSLHC